MAFVVGAGTAGRDARADRRVSNGFAAPLKHFDLWDLSLCTQGVAVRGALFRRAGIGCYLAELGLWPSLSASIPEFAWELFLGG